MKSKLNFLILYTGIFLIAAMQYFTMFFNLISKLVFQFTILFLIPYSIAFAFGIKITDLGLSISLWKKIIFYSVVLILLAVPGMIYAARMPVFQYYYPIFRATNLSSFVYFELLLLPSFLLLEIFYRGFALFSLKKFTGNWAILLQSVPYFLIHIGKPTPELFYSFLVGIVFAYFSIRAKSFMPAFLGHYTTSVIFDILTF